MTLPPRRILDSPEQTSEDAKLLARYLRAVPEPAPFSPAAKERVSRTLLAAAAPSFWGRFLRWALAIVTPLALLGAWSLRGAPAAPKPERIQPAPASSRVAPAPVTVALPQPTRATPEPAPAPAPGSTSAPKEPRPRRRTSAPKPVIRSPVTPAAPLDPAGPVAPEEPPPAPDALVEESQLLQSALHQLRTLHNGEAALSILDQYAQRFPRGQLRAEATLARVDSLLLLGRAAEALARLQGLSAADRARLPRSRELQVLEVELLAEVGRCEEALGELQSFRLRDGEPELDERALFVRATCEAKASRVDRARALYEELLRRWPAGAHASEARRALGKAP